MNKHIKMGGVMLILSILLLATIVVSTAEPDKKPVFPEKIDLLKERKTVEISDKPPEERLKEIQAEIKKKNLKWKAKLTDVAKLPKETKQKMLSGLLPIKDRKSILKTIDMDKLKSTQATPVTQGFGDSPPGEFDWRDVDGVDWVTSVKNQGKCGSCWAFAVVGITESAYNIYNDDPDIDLNLAEQQLVSCDTANNGCGGGWPDVALEYIRDTGLADEACFPYVASNVPCNPCSDWEDRVNKIDDYTFITPATTEAYKKALIEYGPLSVVLNASEDLFYYASGIYEPSDGYGAANHAVVLVGYNDTGGYWIIKNSWGTGEGLNGYYLVAYGNLEQYDYVQAVIGTPHITDKPLIKNPRFNKTVINPGEHVRFNVTITDPDGIDSAKFTIRYPNETLIQNNMNVDSGIDYSGDIENNIITKQITPTLINDDFETSSTFEPDSRNKAPWERGYASQMGGCHNGNSCWGTNLDADYLGDGPYDDYLTQNDFMSFTGFQDLSLEFWHYRYFEYSLGPPRMWDAGVVDIVYDNGTIQRLTPSGGYTGTVSTGAGNSLSGQDAYGKHGADWEKETFDLTPLLGNEPAKIRFYFATDANTAHAGWFIDDVNINGTLQQNIQDANTPISVYNDVTSPRLYGSVSNISVKLEVDSYNPAASVQQSTSNPDLELEIYNGSRWISLGNLNLPSEYTGSGLQTENKNFTVTITNPEILKSWTIPENRDIRIRGVSMDYYNGGSIIDKIDYLNVWVSIDYIGIVYYYDFIDTSQIGIYNITQIIANDTLGNEKIKNYNNLYFTAEAPDEQPPIITNPGVNETLIDAGEHVRFNVTVTDATEVDTVKATFRYPNEILVEKELNRHYIPEEIDFTLQTCTSLWGFDCGESTAGKPGGDNDNTFDSCTSSPLIDNPQASHVDNAYINITKIKTGHSIRVTCEFNPYSDADEQYIWYYNGTGDSTITSNWQLLYSDNAPSGSIHNVSVNFIAHDVIGIHWVRCIDDFSGENDVCANIGNSHDNDDINFIVVDNSPILPTDVFYYDFTDTTQPGIYNVTQVWANDTNGNSNFSNYNDVYFVVGGANNPPVAEANGPYQTLEDNAIMFDATGSYDSDGDNITYYWQFGDSYTSTDKFPVHTYTTPGIYNVNLTVTDEYSASDLDTTIINVTAKSTQNLTGIIMSTTVLNSIPDVTTITIEPSIPSGTIDVNITANVTDMNSHNDIIGVIAYITGPSTIIDSPIMLYNIQNLSTITALFKGTFQMKNTYSSGTYTVNVTATDKAEASDTNETTFPYSSS